MKPSFNLIDLETLNQITGYSFNTPSLLEGVDNVIIAHGIRNRDKLPVVAKLSHQPLRLEREYHTVQRLYKQSSAKELLCRPLERVSTTHNGLIIFIYEDVCFNQLDKFHPYNTPELLHNQHHLFGLSSDNNPLGDLKEVNNTAKNISLDQFLKFAIQCCNCLEMIHKNQIVHGDLKLNAFLWPKDDKVKIWNFGAGSRSLEHSLTSEGWRKTVQRNGGNNFLQMLIYMSPEQTGRTTFQPDHRTDLYSLGITFFVALTQTLPFAHNSPMEIIHSVMNKKIPSVQEARPETPIAISMIIEKLTNKSPDERYTSAHGLREDLKECLRQLELGQKNNTNNINKDTLISPFPLGKYDIASIFTIPNNGCFGRAQELSLINTIIRRTAHRYTLNNRKRRTNLFGLNASAASAAMFTPLKLATEEQSSFSLKRAGSRRESTNSLTEKKSQYSTRKRPTEIIAIYGNTGVGKSTLVRNAKQFAREYGYIATAKFDTRQPLPYGCILRCLSIFLKNILAEPADDIERFANMLKDQLGAETLSRLPTLLVDNVPELSSFFDQPLLQKSSNGVTTTSSTGCECDMEGAEIKLRFHSAFIGIFQVMVNFKFMTLFLEDLHQADEASIELLDSLISAKFDFLTIVTYRNNEVSPLISKLLSNEESIVSYVKIENLDQKALMELVRTTMHRSEEIDTLLLAPLVEFIFKRTHGNPFYTCQLLMTLEKKNLIYFTWEKTRWEYNLQKIDKALSQEMNDDTNGDMNIEFLVRRLKELPRDGRNFLKWASFIGNTFNYETVKQLMIANEDIYDEENHSEEDFEDLDNEENFTDQVKEGLKESRTNTSSDGLQKTALEVSNKPSFNVINGLQSALQHGFIQAFNNDEFKFTHDRYSQAAMMLASPEDRKTIHLRIALHFMSKAEADKFWVADHVKAALHLIKEKETKYPYRKILIQAGDKAFNSGAHKLAFNYYSIAHQLLTNNGNPWVDGTDSKYTETLHLYTRLAEISWVMDYNLTRTYLKTILEHAQSAIDRAAAYRVQHRYRWSHTGTEESAPILLECLRELGIKDIKMDLSEQELKDLYILTRKEVLSVGMGNILQLPVCNSRLIKTRLSILEELCLRAYWTNDIKAILSVGANFILKTLQYGTTPTTGVGFVFFGIAIVQMFKAYDFGEQIGEVGVALCNKYGGNAESARARYLYASFLSSWNHPYHKSVPMARLAIKQGLLGGDRFYAAFSNIYVITANLLMGENVSETLREAKLCLDQTDGLGQTVGLSIIATTLIRVLLAFQGKTNYYSEEEIFDSQDFQESAFVQDAQEIHKDYDVQLYFYYCLKSIVLAFYGFYEASFNLSSKYTHLGYTVPSSRQTHLMFFFRCISIIRLVRNQKLGIEYLDEMECSRSLLQEWGNNSYVTNIQVFLTCIDAELAWLNNEPLKAQKSYDLAIRQARQGKWPIEMALMHEYSADYYYESQNMLSIASTLVEKAIDEYRHIGIYGRATQLEDRFELLFRDYSTGIPSKEFSVQTESNQAFVKRESISDLSVSDSYSNDMFDNNSPTVQSQESGNHDMNFSPEETLLTLDVVDLASILKSSQVISSEVNFDLLMKQMLGIILENSGAESGVIIIKENTSFLIVGCGSQTDGCEIFSTPKLLSEETDSITTRISQYVIHAKETLFIVDVQKDSRFSDYTTQPKSCICTPIIHKSAVVGCIYIEGAIGSLTSRHEVVLRLLSQQIGISVTNALLFKNIQKVTYDNVKMIKNQEAALQEARESKEAALRAMKLKADFLANMSHELRTPFSGFYGMISLLSETTLDAEQQDIVYTAKESCEMLLKIIDDLLNFSKLEAGKVSLDLGPLVVEEVIADTIEILSSLATRKGLELAYVVDPDVPHTLIADSSRLRQILTNLLGNAIKFTHQGGVVIKCHVVKGEFVDSNEFIRLKFEVVDTGIGIRSEQQRQLFEPFSQVDGSTTRMYGGTGLGLSICLQLVNLMLGEISVDSEPDKGSNFWFTIVANHQDKTKDNRRITLSKTAALRLALRHQTILLATESDFNSTMIRSLLSDFTIKQTSDMYQAIPTALQDQHPVLILDMPPKPSNLISHQLQSVDDDPECELHIIILYTPSTEGHKLAAEATNSASDRRGRLVKLAKPVRRIKLLNMLEQVLDHQQHNTSPPSVLSPSIVQLQPTLGNRMRDYFDKSEIDWYYKKPVLIAEDNMIAQKLLRKQLEKMGFLVESANNGEEAVRLWRERPINYFCVGFFDHHMPKCDGVEATKRIRKFEEGTSSRLPIIALTADIQTSARDICVEAGMDGYLTKPLIPKELAKTLRNLSHAIQKHYDTPNI